VKYVKACPVCGLLVSQQCFHNKEISSEEMPRSHAVGLTIRHIASLSGKMDKYISNLKQLIVDNSN